MNINTNFSQFNIQLVLKTVTPSPLLRLYNIHVVISFRIGRVLINSFYMRRQTPIPFQHYSSTLFFRFYVPLSKAITENELPLSGTLFTAHPIKILHPNDNVKWEIITCFYGDLYVHIYCFSSTIQVPVSCYNIS